MPGTPPRDAPLSDTPLSGTPLSDTPLSDTPLGETPGTSSPQSARSTDQGGGETTPVRAAFKMTSNALYEGGPTSPYEASPAASQVRGHRPGQAQARSRPAVSHPNTSHSAPCVHCSVILVYQSFARMYKRSGSAKVNTCARLCFTSALLRRGMAASFRCDRLPVRALFSMPCSSSKFCTSQWPGRVSRNWWCLHDGASILRVLDSFPCSQPLPIPADGVNHHRHTVDHASEQRAVRHAAHAAGRIPAGDAVPREPFPVVRAGEPLV